MPDDPPADAITAAAEALAVHRWKSMGVASAECECGTIVYGDADPFPADEAFRRHLAAAVLEGAALHLHAQAAAAERERLTLAILGCETCDQVHHPRQRCPGEPSHGQTWAAEDGHPYRSRIPFNSSATRAAVADLLREDDYLRVTSQPRAAL